MASVCLLTGKPGTGKTTVIRQALAASKIKAGGFYTEEIRSGATRQGFRIVTLDGRGAVLSHIDNRGPHRVSKYGVDISNLNGVAVAAVEEAIEKSDLIVIDEIGKMELFSDRFRDAVLKAINAPGKVLGTIMLAPHPFADEVKRRPHVRVTELTRSNRERVLQEIVDWIKSYP